MAQLRQDFQKFDERHCQIVVISPEGPDELAELWEKYDLPFIGIPDPGRKMAQAVGQEFKILRLGFMPAMLIIDERGRIRYRHYGKSMSDIPHNRAVLSILDRLQEQTHGVRSQA